MSSPRSSSWTSRAHGKGFDDILRAGQGGAPRPVSSGPRSPGSWRIPRPGISGSGTWTRPQSSGKKSSTWSFSPSASGRGRDPQLAERLGVKLDRHGFCQTDPFRPLETSQAWGLRVRRLRGAQGHPGDGRPGQRRGGLRVVFLAEARGTLSKEECPRSGTSTARSPGSACSSAAAGSTSVAVVDVPVVKEYAGGLARRGLHRRVPLHLLLGQPERDQAGHPGSPDSTGSWSQAARRARTSPCSGDTIREVGFNPYLFEMANIRDQCSRSTMTSTRATTGSPKRCTSG